MNTKKAAVCFIAAVCLALSGCTPGSAKSSVSFTFSVETGDKVKVTLDTSDDYSMTSEVPFAISKGDEVQSQGTFVTKDTYLSYVEIIESENSAEILDSGSKDGIEYLFWATRDEHDYAVYIENSDTGFLIANNVSRESAEECFSRLQFSLVE